MANRIKEFIFFLIILVIIGCDREGSIIEPEIPIIEEPELPIIENDEFSTHPLRIRHAESKLKILAIGNSFTLNASTYLPWLVDELNDDSICFARIWLSSGSLAMHWSNHIENSPKYEMYYSDGGRWVLTDIKTLDDALNVLDWDIIVTQQVSTDSGLYKTYQPYLENLISLFHETNQDAKVAFHCTWAYFPWTKNYGYKSYSYDSEIMYDAIIDACDSASKYVDLIIPSATLVRDMRKEFADIEDTFSTDGYHIIDPFAQYSLGSLWYECLVAPITGTSVYELNHYPNDIDVKNIKKAYYLIGEILSSQDKWRYEGES